MAYVDNAEEGVSAQQSVQDSSVVGPSIAEGPTERGWRIVAGWIAARFQKPPSHVWNRMDGVLKTEPDPTPEADLDAFMRSKAASDTSLDRLNLTQWPLKGTDLSGVDFWSSNFDGVDFGQADVALTKFGDCSLRYSNLAEVKNLTSAQLAGADLEGAQLPTEIGKFEELKTVEELSKNVGKVILVLFGAIAFSLSTVFATKPQNLFLSGGTVKLPVLDAQVSYEIFYVMAPLILLGAFVYLHLYLQRLWDTIAKLPAVFPDGRRLDERSYPWLFNDYGTQYFPRLVGRLPRLHSLQKEVYTFMAWRSMPLILLPFPIYSLCRHSPQLTTFHLFIIGLAAWLAVFFRRFAVSTLTWRINWLRKNPEERMRRILRIVGLFLVFQAPTAFCFWVIATCFANQATEPVRPVWSRLNVARAARWLLERPPLKLQFDANLSSLSLSKLEGTGPAQQESPELGAILRRLNLADANLSLSDLRMADLSQTDFIGANFTETKMPKAVIGNTDFDKADLTNADLSESRTVRAMVDLDDEEAKKRGPTFRETDLTKTNLSKSKLLRPDFSDAVLSGTHLSDATFVLSNFVNSKLIDVDAVRWNASGCFISGSTFDGGSFPNAWFGPTDNATASTFTDSIFTGGDFTGAQFDHVSVATCTFRCNLKDASWTGATILGNWHLKTPIFTSFYGAKLWHDIGTFNGATLKYVHFADVTVDDRTFPKASLDHCSFSRCTISAFKQTTFSSMPLKQFDKNRTRFEGCTFIDCDFNEAPHLTFVNCRAAGTPGQPLPKGIAAYKQQAHLLGVPRVVGNKIVL